MSSVPVNPDRDYTADDVIAAFDRTFNENEKVDYLPLHRRHWKVLRERLAQAEATGHSPRD